MSNTWLDDVAVDDDIEYTWGNTVRDRVVHYFADTTTRDAEITGAARKTGMVVMVGTASGTGTALPRYYMWNGSAWLPIGWWGSTGRLGVTLTDAAQSINTASLTTITWGTEVQDPDGWTSGGSGTLTVPSGHAGVYAINFTAKWASASLGTTPYVIMAYNSADEATAAGLTTAGIHTLGFPKALAAGDTLIFAVYQNSGGSVNVTSRLEIARIGV